MYKTETPKMVLTGMTSKTIDKNNKSIYFKNNPKNENYCLQYQVYDENDKLIWDSYEDKGYYIAPGEDSGVNFYPMDYFDKGTHSVKVVIKSFRIEDLVECNPFTYHMDIIIKW